MLRFLKEVLQLQCHCYTMIDKRDPLEFFQVRNAFIFASDNLWTGNVFSISKRKSFFFRTSLIL
jgi:hypothetical protein